MTDEVEDAKKKFYKWVDEHINLANSHISEGEMIGPITGAMMFGTARFNTWMVAFGSDNAEHLKSIRDETIELFSKQYTDLLSQHFDDYIKNYETHLQKRD